MLTGVVLDPMFAVGLWQEESSPVRNAADYTTIIENDISSRLDDSEVGIFVRSCERRRG